MRGTRRTPDNAAGSLQLERPPCARAPPLYPQPPRLVTPSPLSPRAPGHWAGDTLVIGAGAGVTLVCGTGGCAAAFSGPRADVMLSRHRRVPHDTARFRPCQARCGAVFATPQAAKVHWVQAHQPLAAPRTGLPALAGLPGGGAGGLGPRLVMGGGAAGATGPSGQGPAGAGGFVT